MLWTNNTCWDVVPGDTGFKMSLYFRSLMSKNAIRVKGHFINSLFSGLNSIHVLVHTTTPTITTITTISTTKKKKKMQNSWKITDCEFLQSHCDAQVNLPGKHFINSSRKIEKHVSTLTISTCSKIHLVCLVLLGSHLVYSNRLALVNHSSSHLMCYSRALSQKHSEPS